MAVALCGMRTILEEPGIAAFFKCEACGHELIAHSDDLPLCPVCGSERVTQQSADVPETNPRRSPL